MKPAPITEAQVERINKSYCRRHDFARAIIAARDKQWAEMLGEQEETIRILNAELSMFHKPQEKPE